MENQVQLPGEENTDNSQSQTGWDPAKQGGQENPNRGNPSEDTGYKDDQEDDDLDQPEEGTENAQEDEDLENSDDEDV